MSISLYKIPTYILFIVLLYYYIDVKNPDDKEIFKSFRYINFLIALIVRFTDWKRQHCSQNCYLVYFHTIFFIIFKVVLIHLVMTAIFKEMEKISRFYYDLILDGLYAITEGINPLKSVLSKLDRNKFFILLVELFGIAYLIDHANTELQVTLLYGYIWCTVLVRDVFT